MDGDFEGSKAEAGLDDALRSRLDLELRALGFPTRLVNWARRKKLTRVSELVRFRPAELRAEPNLGRTTIAQTRRVLERTFGSTWEELHTALSHDVPAEPDSDASQAPYELPPARKSVRTDWDGLSESLAPSLLDRPLDSLDLPTRMQNFADREGLRRVRDLVAIDHTRLLTTKNLGRRSITQTLQLLLRLQARESEGPVSLPSLDRFGTFFDVWRHHQAMLASFDRLVLGHRAGFFGPAPTLRELGETFHLTRERIRQIEARAIAKLKRRGWWIEACEARLEQVLAGAVLSLDEIEAADPFFEGLEERIESFRFFLKELSSRRLFVVDWDSRSLLGTAPPRAWNAAFQALSNGLASRTYPMEQAELDGCFEEAATDLPRGARRYLEERIRPLLFVDEAQGVVTGFGRSRIAEVTAFLRASPTPVRVGEIVERFGRGALPDDVVFVDRGLVGLPHHLPDYERWSERLPPVCASSMRSIAPERQFTTSELVENLKEEAHLPPWLNAWTLGSILRNAKEVRYLGRNVVTLPEVEGDRVHVRELFVSILDEAGHPLGLDELRRLAAERRGIAGAGNLQLLTRPPFVEVEEGYIGLVERDIPGGRSALQQAADALYATLEDRQKGMLAIEATRFVQTLSPTHARFKPFMVRSLARLDGRFRLVSNGSIGLAEWGEVRAPNRSEVLASLLDEHGGRAPVSLALSRLEESFGVRLSLHKLGCIAYGAGARLRADFIVRHETPASSAPAQGSLVPVEIPDEARPLFESLLAEPIGDLEMLADEVAAHLRRYEDEASRNPFLDLAEARQLASLCHALLARLPTEPGPEKQKLLWAAVRYFAIDDDGNSDFTIGGLDDDRAVLEAVVAHLDG